MRLTRILTTAACGLCVSMFLLAGPQSTATQTEQQPATQSQTPAMHGQSHASGAPQQCQEAQQSLDKAYAMYTQLKTSGSSPGTSASAASPSSTTSSSTTSTTTSPSTTSPSTTSPSTTSPSATSSTTTTATGTTSANGHTPTWDSFNQVFEQARSQLSSCIVSINAMHMQNGSGKDKDKDKDKP